MASSSSSSSSSQLRKNSCSFKTMMIMAFVIVLLFGSCSASRLRKISVAMKAETASSSERNIELQPQMGFRFRGQTFNFFPKGKPVPPSGPSKRHNSSPKN